MIAGDVCLLVAVSAWQVMSSADVGRAIRQLRAAAGATSGAPPATARSPRSQYPSQRGGGGVQDTLVSVVEALMALLAWYCTEMVNGRLCDACVALGSGNCCIACPCLRTSKPMFTKWLRVRDGLCAMPV